jgi:hypothetical protein
MVVPVGLGLSAYSAAAQHKWIACHWLESAFDAIRNAVCVVDAPSMFLTSRV